MPKYFHLTVPRPNLPLPDSLLKLATNLGLAAHPEGGYFKQTDKSPFLMRNPYQTQEDLEVRKADTEKNESEFYTEVDVNTSRSFSTLIFYLLTPQHPMGRFHLNKSRIIHILQKGSGTYVTIDPKTQKVETFKVGFGPNERLQWVVEGGVYKASFTNNEQEGLLISEVVVPGWEFADHKFMENEDELRQWVGNDEDKIQELKWLLGGQFFSQRQRLEYPEEF
ncbi:hypothetical protein NADFUDRAFT_83563 [Nadsonia fulvescens var. elongata DSM 6958]|uniref:DUF985 domain-containing protein n=1 Tax=Nadsonia fulvescens var. elongata DSM 6958 TaxID=857566 RepID=A0A1E3PGU5_9ASCO|nr:hypothetical protein NADFUDRAFT_83563 [Nadsonia fulvescens var. elongata DSM 6958]